MLFLGFSAGLPYLLIFGSLGIWLREAGFEKSVVTLFALAGLGYSFKFVWAPLVDQLPLPWLTRLLGRRRAWMLLAQIAIACAILLMASIDRSTGGWIESDDNGAGSSDAGIFIGDTGHCHRCIPH